MRYLVFLALWHLGFMSKGGRSVKVEIRDDKGEIRDNTSNMDNYEEYRGALKRGAFRFCSRKNRARLRRARSFFY